jgi:hypothetical protein
MTTPLPPGSTRRTDWLRCSGNPCTCPKPEPEWSAEDAVTALLSLVAVYETKPPAHRAIPTYLVREYITGERAK